MKIKNFVIILTLLLCLNVYGQQNKTVPTTVQPQKTEVQVLEEAVLQLQAENQAMQKQIEKMEKEVELYRGDVINKIAEIDENQSRWLTMLAIIMGLIGIVFGVCVPMLININNNKVLEIRLSETKNELEIHVQAATEQAIQAEKSAKEAHADMLFTEARALSEEKPIDAIELYTEMIEYTKMYDLNNDLSSAYNNRGILEANIGNIGKAFKDYNKAIELDPNGATAYVNRGTLKSDLGDYTDAVEDYNTAIELEPNSALYYQRGIIKSKKLEDYEGALKDYDTAIMFDPKDTRAYNNRAMILMRLGQYDKALLSINNAIQMNINEFVQWNTKGEICMNMKNYEKAIFSYSNALKLNPFDMDSLDNRAKCYRNLAEKEEEPTKKAELIAKAEEDEKNADSFRIDKEL